MQIIKDFLTKNEYSRPEKRLKQVKAIVMHWTANPDANAKQNRDFFETRKTAMGGYGSAHFIIGQKGEIIQCIPINEVAYHCGSGKPDPVSNEIYTNYARLKLGHYCANGLHESPNFCTIGIELCPIDWSGNFTDETIKSAIELCVELCKKYNLTSEDITTHHDIVGWKDCPKLWTDHPNLFEAFKLSVQDKLQRG